MDDLVIPIVQDEYDKPFVNFQVQTGKCELSGESFPSKAAEYYDILMSWIDQYIKEVNGPIYFDFKLTYFNTSSSKRLLHLMMRLREYAEEGGQVKARWIYHPDDIDLEEDIRKPFSPLLSVKENENDPHTIRDHLNEILFYLQVSRRPHPLLFPRPHGIVCSVHRSRSHP